MEFIIETAIPNQPAVLAELTRPTAGYRRSARLAVAGLLAFVVLYFGLAGWFLYSAWHMIQATLHGGNVLVNWCTAIIAVLLAVVMLKAIFAVRNSMSPGMVEVKREEQPRLFDYLMDLADTAGAPRPHRVFLSNRVNAAVFYDLSLLNLIFPSKKNLEIGLPLVNALPLGELRAVLAHEFGHFAQRSMAVGRWAYVAQQVVQEMVARRDALDEFIDRVGNVDIRLRLAAWVVQIIIWSLRSLVEQAFRLVVLMQRALSREMEMQADLVAVSLTGSDALVHALHRLGAADDAWERTVGFVFGEHGSGRATSDAFAVQNHITARMAGILDDPFYGKVPPLPQQQPDQHRVFKVELGQPPRMWQTHPQNHEREENAKRRYLPAAIDQSSAWSLFDDAAGLRQRMTAHLLEGQDGKAELVELEESLKRLAKEYRREHFQSRYCGVYFGRSLTRHAAKAAELLAARNAQPVVEASALYPLTLKDDVRQLRQLQEERAQLSALIKGHTKVQGNRVQLGGEEFKLNQLPAAMQSTEERIKQLEEKLLRHDATVRAWHYTAAQKLGGGWPAYLDSLLDVLHYAEHCAANLRDAWELVLNTRAVVTAVARQSESNIRRLIDDCGALYVVLDEVYRGNGKVQLDPQMMERLEITESWQVTLQKFTLPPVTRDNINDWLQGVGSWTSHTTGWLGALRAAALEQLLVCETLLASHARSGQEIASAPEPCQVPQDYTVLLHGSERKLQTSLDWWARFQRADGWLAGGARLAVASGIVVSVLGMGVSLGTSTVIVYNGLVTPVRVTIDGNSKTIEPGHDTRIDASLESKHKVEAHLADGRLLESFSGEDGSSQSIYNVGSGAVMATYVVHYGGRGGDEQSTVLGAPRWFQSEADIVFQEPPESVSSKTKNWRKVLVAAVGLDPQSMWNNVKDEAERKAMLIHHAQWDKLEQPSTAEWLGLAFENGAGDVMAQRLKDNPENVQLRRMEQRFANESPEICAAANERAKARPDDGDRLYLALRCKKSASNEDVAAALARFPGNPWLLFLQARRLMDNGAWEEALEPLRKLQGKLPYENEELEVALERVRRMVDGEVKSRSQRPHSRALALVQMESDAKSPFAALARGELNKALQAAQADPAQAARMRLLVAASDGATAAQVQAALDQPVVDGSNPDTLIMSALAMRYGRDAEPYWANATALREYAPKLRRFLEAAKAGKYMEADQQLGAIQVEVRILAYSAGVVVAGPNAPARWRKTARLMLFVGERPYLRS